MTGLRSRFRHKPVRPTAERLSLAARLQQDRLELGRDRSLRAGVHKGLLEPRRGAKLSFPQSERARLPAARTQRRG